MARSTFVFHPDHPRASPFGMVAIEDAGDFRPEGEGHVAVVGDMHHDQVTSPIDGTLIDSKKKRREHMKQHGIADYDDFQGARARFQKQREDLVLRQKLPERDRAKLREDVRRSIYKLGGDV